MSDTATFAVNYNNYLKKLAPDQPEFIFTLGKLYYEYKESLIQEILS
jgi:hypothetical protein